MDAIEHTEDCGAFSPTIDPIVKDIGPFQMVFLASIHKDPSPTALPIFEHNGLEFSSVLDLHIFQEIDSQHILVFLHLGAVKSVWRSDIRGDMDSNA